MPLVSMVKTLGFNVVPTDLCGENGFQGIPHPKTDCDFKGVIATESIEQWAERFYKWFEKLSIATI